jgi:hypothetical protein
MFFFILQYVIVCTKFFSYLWSVSWCVLMLNDPLNSVYVFLKEGGGEVGRGWFFMLLSMWLYCECFVKNFENWITLICVKFIHMCLLFAH